MEAASQRDNSPGRNLTDDAADLDLLDQFLTGDGWLDFQDCSDTLQTGTPNSMSPFNSLSFSPLFEFSNCSNNPVALERTNQDVKEKYPMESTEHATQSFSSDTIGQIIYSVQSGEMHIASSSSEPGTSWWIQPKDASSSVKNRLMQALSYIKDAHRDSDVLVQLWVPVRKEGQLVLTTYSQPFLLNPDCEKLVNYREVSVSYQFSAEENSSQALGLPGRVFLQRLPEWTPDVRYFSSNEYPRVSYAQRFDVRGSIALPVFEHGSQSCLGVVEVVMTTEKIMYSFELENICNALRAVNLRSSQVLTVPRVLVGSYSYQVAQLEILDVLKAVCKLHALPLAQTWVPCVQQGKQGSRHSNENYEDCVSTDDDTCYINDPSILDFHKACSEHHLLRGQGVVGRAFTTNQPCYVPDITVSCKSEYPLAHHARMFGLKGAVAIRLRSTRTGTSDFVLEFFLPMSCTGVTGQKMMLDSLSSSVQNVCQTLRVVTAKELEDDSTSSDVRIQKSNYGLGPEQNFYRNDAGQICDKEMPRGVITSMPTTVDDSKGKMRDANPELNNNELEGFGITTQKYHQQEVIISENKIFSNNCHQDLLEDHTDLKESFANVGRFLSTANEVEKRRRKTEKTISLHMLRKHFAGSLKDAAKSLGVCPTTLKRICRQHGITRWPSRKIKKVDHSLKKLQLVIDSVHGADKAIQLPSLYKDFTSPSGSNGNSSGVVLASSLTRKNHRKSTDKQHEVRLNGEHSSSSCSSSACTQKSNSSLSSSVGEQHCSQAVEPLKPQVAMEEILSCIPQVSQKVNVNSTAKETQSLHKSQGQRPTSEHYSVDILSPVESNKSNWIRVKATYGADKVRLRLDPTWGFQDLKLAILKRFSVDIMGSVNLKYLDDDSEWVLLTCDADLHECIHVYKSMGAQTIKISLQPITDKPNNVPLGLIK